VFVVQDMLEGNREGTRQLVFTSNLKAVQTEIRFRFVGGKKKKRVFDHA
jgi:hypothetical protein